MHHLHTHDDKLLREAIRQILREEAGPGKIEELVARVASINSNITQHHTSSGGDPELAPIFGVAINHRGESAEIIFAVKGMIESDRITLSDELTPSMSAMKLGINIPVGSVRIGRNDENPCLQAWSVAMTETTTEGWGPLLYDVAIELATQEAGGLMSDRESVTDDALGVWDKYDKSRGDVEKLQLDISDDNIEFWADNKLKHRTPEIDDDCTQLSALEGDPGGRFWYKSPLSRVYRKPPTTIGVLDSMGFLFRNLRRS